MGVYTWSGNFYFYKATCKFICTIDCDCTKTFGIVLRVLHLKLGKGILESQPIQKSSSFVQKHSRQCSIIISIHVHVHTQITQL